MLPATPLHHLLLERVGLPLVATSGNRSEEPICIDEREAVERLGSLCDGFLVHDRPIERHVDDSVGRRVAGEFRLLRRARGYAPLPIEVRNDNPTVLAVGGHLKNTIALAVGRQVFLSQHIGDLETLEAQRAFERVIADFLRLYEARPVAVAHDLHPAYVSTLYAKKWAAEHGIPAIAVQHHHAHLAACLAEHRMAGPALGVTWDGTGHGLDGTVWGGEFLLGSDESFSRVAHLLPFRLPGGEAAVREPRRTALAILWELGGPALLQKRDLAAVASFSDTEIRLMSRMLETGFNSPVTTSAGRLFDGVAGLLGLHLRSSFEGQAAMDLEWNADASETGVYPIRIEPSDSAPIVLDWRPMIAAVIEDLHRGVSHETIAGRFHRSLAEAIVRVARMAGAAIVALSGGCFQNALLTEIAKSRLEEESFQVLLHERVPPGDGGISLGQVMVARASILRST
jgi:hydrogenase maturation protein HypF